MGSTVAVAYQIAPDGFIDRFCDGPSLDGVYGAAGLSVLCGSDFVIVRTTSSPRTSVDAVLSEVERALPGVRDANAAVAVGLDGGGPHATTTFDEWTEHWIRGRRLAEQGAEMVAKAMFGAVIQQGLIENTGNREPAD